MTVKEDISAIRAALQKAEREPTRRNVLALHNRLGQAMVRHKDKLGLSDDEVQAFGGGTDKPEEA